MSIFYFTNGIVMLFGAAANNYLFKINFKLFVFISTNFVDFFLDFMQKYYS